MIIAYLMYTCLYEVITQGNHYRCMSLVMRNQLFAYAKAKTQISFAVTAKLISAFVFATWIVQSLFFLNPKFQASSNLLWLYSLVCVRPGRKAKCWFSHDAAQIYHTEHYVNAHMRNSIITSVKKNNFR